MNPNGLSTLILNFTHHHGAGDEIQLRFGGGVIPGGGDIQLNIQSIQWIINEN